MRYILSGAAAIAFAAGGAFAQPGKGNGNGNGNGGGQENRGNAAAASMQKKAGRQQPANGNARADVARDRGKTAPDRARQVRPDPPAGPRPQRATPNNGQGAAVRNANARSPERRFARDRRSSDTLARVVDRTIYDSERALLRRDARRSLVEGCPPGLAKKANGCLPPGQAGQYYERGLFGLTYRPGIFGLSNYGDGRYAYNDGYLLRLGNGGGINGYIPLLGGALAIGNAWPAAYDYYEVPDYYVDYYDLGGRDQYRYADDVIYRYDAEDAAITAIAALLTGDDFAIGQPMPRGYDVYNVPYAYRDRYYDTPDSWYRYSDGYVYRVDPETRLVAAAIDLLV